MEGNNNDQEKRRSEDQGSKNAKQGFKIKMAMQNTKEDQMLWRAINEKYEEDKWMTKEMSTPYGVSLWRSIRNLWTLLKSKCSIKIAEGSRTNFWEDVWLGTESLKEKLPYIYNLVVHQHRTVAKH